MSNDKPNTTAPEPSAAPLSPPLPVQIAQTAPAKPGRIFISMATFCDPYLMFTLDSLFSTARHPERVFVAVVNQHVEDNREELESRSYFDRLRYVYTHAIDSRGLCWARSIAFSLYRDEDFMMQIDSHTWFKPDWDVQLESQLIELEKQIARPIITTYPPGFHFDDNDQPVDDLEVSTLVMPLRVHANYNLRLDDPVLMFVADWVSGKPFELGFHVAGGFVFTRGAFVRQVPHDTALYFHGEEQSLAVRAWTKGWNIVHPRMCDIPLRHLYKDGGRKYRDVHWRSDLEKRRRESFGELIERSKKRLSDVVYSPQPDDLYGIGKVRSLAGFAAFSGIDYVRRRVWRERPDERATHGSFFDTAPMGRVGVRTRYGSMTVFANDRYISRSLYVYGQWAQAELNALIAHIKPGDVVVDVGAWLGYSSMALSQAVGATGRVIAIEPQLELAAVLWDNLVENGVTVKHGSSRREGKQPNNGPVDLVICALRAEKAEGFMPALPTEAGQNLGALQVLPKKPPIQDGEDAQPAAGAAVKPDGKRVVVLTLDAFALNRCDAIKLDAAGSELAVLKGAEQTICRLRPVVLVEFNAPQADQIREWVATLENYQLIPISSPIFEADNFRRESVDVFPGVALNNALLVPAEKRRV